jgi:hypothetical protein
VEGNTTQSHIVSFPERPAPFVNLHAAANISCIFRDHNHGHGIVSTRELSLALLPCLESRDSNLCSSRVKSRYDMPVHFREFVAYFSCSITVMSLRFSPPPVSLGSSEACSPWVIHCSGERCSILTRWLSLMTFSHLPSVLIQ